MQTESGEIFEDFDRLLRAERDPERAKNEKSYLKSPIDHYGCRVPAIREAVKVISREYGGLDRMALLELAGRLWSSTVHEHRMAAVILLEQHAGALESKDLELVREMIRESFTWAYVDTLSGKVAGDLILRFPQLAGALDEWATDESFWVRRGALLALIGPLRQGQGDWKRFVRYADRMLDESEFFIRKAIGWVLRETSKQRPDLVLDFVESRLARMPGVTFREAVKYLPEEERERLRRAREAEAPSR